MVLISTEVKNISEFERKNIYTVSDISNNLNKAMMDLNPFKAD